MRLQTNVFAFFLSENIDYVTQDASNFCRSCQDIKINFNLLVSNFNSSKPGIRYSSGFLK